MVFSKLVLFVGTLVNRNQTFENCLPMQKKSGKELD